MAGDMKRVGLVFGTDGVADLKKQINEVNNALASNRNEFKKTTLSYGDNVKASQKLADEQKYLSAQYDNQKTRIEALRSELERYENSEGASKKSVDNKRNALEKAEIQLINYDKRLKDVNQSIKNGTADLDQMAKKVDDVGKKMSNAGGSFTKNLTAPIVAVGAASIVAFKTVDEAYDNLIIKTGKTGAELEDLTNTFDSIYGNFPFETQETSDAISEVSTRFGYTSDQLEEASVAFLKFSEINKTDVSSSVASVSRALQGANEPLSSYQNLLDIATVASQKSGISVDSLFSSYEKYGAQLRLVGFDMNESVALLAQVEKSGLNVETVYTALKTANKEWASSGKNASEEFGKVIESIKNAKTDTEALQIATETFGSKSAVEFTEGIRTGKFAIDEMVTTLSGYEDATNKTFDATLDPIDESTIAMNNLVLAGAELGNEIQTTLGPIFESLSEIIKGITTWFKGLDGTTKTIILTILALLAAIGPVLLILGALASSISNIMILWGMISAFMAGPLIASIGAILAPILAIIAVLALVALASEGFRKSIGEFIDGIMNIFSGLIDFIVGIFTGDWERAWQGVISVFAGIWESLVAIAKAPLNVLVDIVNYFFGMLNDLKFGPLPDWLKYIGLGSLAGMEFDPFDFKPLAYMAKGGELMNGMAMVAEAGPELLLQQGSSTKVIPLTSSSGTKTEIIDYDKLGQVFYRVMAKVMANTKLSLDDEGFIRLIKEELLKVS